MQAPADKAALDREFSRFYREHLRDVYNYTYYRTSNHHDAEDLTTQTFIQAYRHFERAQREADGRPLRWRTSRARSASSTTRRIWWSGVRRPWRFSRACSPFPKTVVRP